MEWWQNAKWNLDEHFRYAAEAWSGVCLYTCYNVFIEVGCDGLHYASSGNEVLPCVQAKFCAVSFFVLVQNNFTWSFLSRETRTIPSVLLWQLYNVQYLSVYNGLIFPLTYLLNHLLTYSITPWSRVFLEKLTGSLPVKRFPAFYGNRKFITAFTSARHLSLSWARSIQSMLSNSHPRFVHIFTFIVNVAPRVQCWYLRAQCAVHPT